MYPGAKKDVAYFEKKVDRDTVDELKTNWIYLKPSEHPKKICDDIKAIIATNTETGQWFRKAYLSWYFENESVYLRHFEKLEDEHAQLFVDMLMLRKKYPWYEDKFHALTMFIMHYNKDRLLADLARQCTDASP
jgi:hypothetical protein